MIIRKKVTRNGKEYVESTVAEETESTTAPLPVEHTDNTGTEEGTPDSDGGS